MRFSKAQSGQNLVESVQNFSPGTSGQKFGGGQIQNRSNFALVRIT